MKKKKMRFLPYYYWPVLLLSLPLPIGVFAISILMIFIVFVEGSPIWFPLMMLAVAAVYFAIAVFIGLGYLREILFTCAPIEISEEGISRGFFNKETYRWEEVTQFGVTLLDPPERGNRVSTDRYGIRIRSIYLVFGLPGEEPAVEWDISRFGVEEFWYRTERAERILGFANDLLGVLDKRIGGEYHDEVFDCFFPRRFMAMKFTTERFLLINSYLKKAGFDPAVLRAGDS